MTSDLNVRIARFLRRHKLSAAKMVVAVSGGPDSVCLLHLLSSIKDEMGLALHVAHLDHGLRGGQSDADAEYVATLARRLGLPVTLGHADVKAYQHSRRMTLEEAARDVRYSFLAGVCQETSTGIIVTGHTQNDNIETILLHIVRGSGTRGLAGLKPLTPRTVDGTDILIARPMLDITREETVAYCQALHLEPRIDASNFELSPLRNKIRLKLLPMLQEYNSNIGGALLRLSATAAEELDYLERQAAELLAAAIKREGDVITLDRERLKKVHSALKKQLLRTCLEGLPGGLKDIELRHIEDMLALLDKPAGRRIDLPYGLVFMTGYDSYRLGKETDLPCPFPAIDGEYPLTVPGVTQIPGWKVNASVVSSLKRDDGNAMAAYMDMDRVGQQLGVRTWKRGDRFQPLGMAAEKKLGEFMIDARIPKSWRRNIPVTASPGGIVWLVGYRLDEKAKVTPETKRILRLEFNRV